MKLYCRLQTISVYMYVCICKNAVQCLFTWCHTKQHLNDLLSLKVSTVAKTLGCHQDYKPLEVKRVNVDWFLSSRQPFFVKILVWIWCDVISLSSSDSEKWFQKCVIHLRIPPSLWARNLKCLCRTNLPDPSAHMGLALSLNKTWWRSILLSRNSNREQSPTQYEINHIIQAQGHE